jgi:sugar lactone lactonase YvrE
MAIPTISGDEVRCVLKWDAIVGESPLWHSRQRRLYWVDIHGRKVHRFDPQTSRNETFDLPDPVTSLAFCKGGGLLLTLRKEFAFFDPDSGKLETIAEVEADMPNTRFNDAAVDPQGRFWAGTIGDPQWDAPVGSLYRLDANLQVTPMLSGLICSNGTGWSPDGRTMYHTESFRYTIFAYDFDAATGSISNGRIFAEVDRSAGAFPDGLCVDAEGFVWSNQVGMGRVVRYDPAGKIERQILLPVPRAVGCGFGGDDLQTLYITSARETMTPSQLAEAPLSGSLFAVRVDVKGQRENEFGEDKGNQRWKDAL